MPDSPNEIYECAAWIKATLEGDVSLAGLIEGVYLDQVPEEVQLPAVRFHVQAPKTVRGVGRGRASRIFTQIDWLIVVMREGHGITPLVPIVQRLDTVLTGATGSTSLCNIDACELIEPFQMLETDKSGVQVRHAGGIYRTIVTPK